MDRYEWKLAAACVRGAAGKQPGLLPEVLRQKPLEELTGEELERIFRAGEEAGLRMYHFKKKDVLPRVHSVLGFLKGIQPESLLDVGSGRGVFLFPFLNTFPWVPVTAMDLLEHRVEMLENMASGGISQLTVLQQDICSWEKEAGSFDVVTLLEVLEHIPDVQAAVQAALRLARRYVVVSVPSKPDDNPEHIHLLSKDILTELFRSAGCTKLHFGGVNGHLILMATVDRETT